MTTISGALSAARPGFPRPVVSNATHTNPMGFRMKRSPDGRVGQEYTGVPMCANRHDVGTPLMTRRRLLEILGLPAGAALAARARPQLSTVFAAGPQSFPVTHVNHLSLVVGDYATSRDFYMDLF